MTCVLGSLALLCSIAITVSQRTARSAAGMAQLDLDFVWDAQEKAGLYFQQYGMVSLCRLLLDQACIRC